MPHPRAKILVSHSETMPFPTRVGRYEIKGRIGGGGMGVLFLARDTNPNTDRLVALKLLSANLEQGDLRARFAREARSLAALSHPNIVIIHDSGEFQGSPFMVMEYVRGESLAEKIRRQAPMSLGQKLRLMMELCEGLGHAHDAGIVHRDIKPANLMVDQHGRLKLLDFGIAREDGGRHTRGAMPLTRLHTSIGTPGYMSPEQIEGIEIDHRSDLFSVGTVFYELMAYKEAFPGVSTRQIEKRVLHDAPLPLADSVPDVDPEIEALILRALEKEVGARVQSASEMLQALHRIRTRLGPEVSQATRVTPVPSTDPTGSRESRRGRAAEAAYQRSAAARAEGAVEFARRSALEALAESPEHQAARVLLQELGGDSDLLGDDATVLVTQYEGLAERTLAREEDVRAAVPVQRSNWLRYAPLAGAVALAVAVLFGVTWSRGGLTSTASDATVGSGSSRATPPAVPPTGVAATTPPETEKAPTSLIARVEDRDGATINDVELTLNPGNVVAPGNGSGEYLFLSVTPGVSYTMTARHRSFLEKSVSVMVGPGGGRQTVVLERGPGMARADRAGRESGRAVAGGVASTPSVGAPTRGTGSSAADAGPGSTAARLAELEAEAARRRGEPNEPPKPVVPPVRTEARSPVLAQDALERAQRALNEDGDLDRAERLLSEAQRFDPDSPAVAKEVARLRDIRATERRQRIRGILLRAQRLYREAGDLDGALREVESALKVDASDTDALALRDEIRRVKDIESRRP